MPRISQKHIPLLSTIGVFLLLYAIASLRYDRFFTVRVFLNFFRDNSFLGIIAVGMTFVILSGGIDLSVGSVLALTTVVAALLIERLGVHPALAIVAVLVMGTAVGFAMGCVIHHVGIAPFIVTLAGLFFARGLALVLCDGSITIDNPIYRAVTAWKIPIGRTGLPLTALTFLAVLVVGIYVSVYTSFGRNVYAIGGNEEAAMLMGVPIGKTKIGVYTLSGFCSALAGVIYTLYGSSGDPRAGVGLELDAIASVVVGGTLLSGGVGYVFGTLIGVLIFGVIQTAITFENLNSWWTRVAIGLLLLLFILLQRLFARPRLRANA